jgi:mRNA-degrading endonuclease RelE of RelBE toxin-antitoxin system
LFIPFFGDDFKKHLDKLTKKDGTLKNRLLERIGEMSKEQPQSQIGYVGELKGKWKMRVGDYRLIYAYCQDCKKHKHQNHNMCYGCSTKADNALIFFDVIHRSNDYDL